MKDSKYTLKTAIVLLLFLAVTGWFGQGPGKDRVYAAEHELGKPLEKHLGNIPSGFHSWTPPPGRVIYGDRFYPPDAYPHYRHPDYRHPDYRYPGARHYFYPPYYHYPFHAYPPYYEPETPWYEKDSPIPAGRVELYVDPVQARAFVNGHPMERHADLSYEVGLLEGEHVVEVKAEGYAPYERTIEIRGGDMIRLTIRLERASGQ